MGGCFRANGRMILSAQLFENPASFKDALIALEPIRPQHGSASTRSRGEVTSAAERFLAAKFRGLPRVQFPPDFFRL